MQRQKYERLKELLTREFLQGFLLSGKTILELAKELNCNPESIYSFLHKYELKKRKHRTFIDLNDQQFGFWLVLKYSHKSFKGPHYWLCRCLICNKEFQVSQSGLVQGKTKKCRYCRKREEFKGFREISGSYWGRIKHGARLRNLEFDITIEYAWDLFLKQEMKCVITNLLLTISRITDKATDQTASLDRINSSKGYIVGNVQWVHKVINKMKCRMSNEEFINWCRIVVTGNE